MKDTTGTHQAGDIEYRVVYSRRRTLGISVLPDSSVIVRVPLRTSDKTIDRIVREKSSWIIRHRDNYRNRIENRPASLFANGGIHLFRGNECVLKIEKSKKTYVAFSDHTIGMGLERTDDAKAISKLLYKGYKDEAVKLFPEIFEAVLARYKDQDFRPSALIIRTMKRRWGSCSSKGVITLNTALIKLPDLYLEYVITHELCHLKHHNHGPQYYKLLGELCPEWKSIRKKIRDYQLS